MEAEVAQRSWRIGVAVVGGTGLVWAVVMALAARAAGVPVLTVSSWGRWDTGHYLSIAESGYAFGPCDGVANRGPEDFCGSSGWFPGYPYAIRVASRLGMARDVAGWLIAVVAMVVAWTVLWVAFLRRLPRRQALCGMALAAVFPGCVYYGAIFPISTMVAATLVSLALLDRHRWLYAGLAGAVAAMVYPSGLLVGTAALVPLLTPTLGSWGARLRAALAAALPVAAGYLLVLANFQRATGHWDAWFKTSGSYHFATSFPLVTIVRQIGHLGSDAIPGVIGVQTTLVAIVMVAAGWVVARRLPSLSIGERAAAVIVVPLWLVPLTLGGDLSLYRAEALLLPVVIVLAHLRPIVVGALAVAAAPIAYRMATLFFEATLI